MRWLLVLLLTTGCRQVLGIDEGAVVEDATTSDSPFDSPADVRLEGHDEDLDTIIDDTDNCPATPNTNQLIIDTVGQACDPRPLTPGDRIALFVPFFPVGQVGTLVSASATYADDYIELDQGDIRTTLVFTPVRVATDFTVISLTSPNASFELSVSSRACRLQQCGGTVCLIADIGTTTSMQPVSTNQVEGTLTLTQTTTELQCVLALVAQPPITVVLVQNGMGANQVRAKADKATIRMRNLTVYVADL